MDHETRLEIAKTRMTSVTYTAIACVLLSLVGFMVAHSLSATIHRLGKLEERIAALENR